MKKKGSMAILMTAMTVFLVIFAVFVAARYLGKGGVVEDPQAQKYWVICNFEVKNSPIVRSEITHAVCVRGNPCGFLSVSAKTLGFFGISEDSLYMRLKIGNSDSRDPIIGTFKLEEGEMTARQIDVCTSSTSGTVELLGSKDEIIDSMNVEVIT